MRDLQEKPSQELSLSPRRWLNGDALPAQDKLRVLAEWLGVGAEWLRFGSPAGGQAAPYQVRGAGLETGGIGGRKRRGIQSCGQSAIAAGSRA